MMRERKITDWGLECCNDYGKNDWMPQNAGKDQEYERKRGREKGDQNVEGKVDQ